MGPLWPLVVTCGPWWSPVVPGGHLWPLVVTCGPLVVTCGPWWSPVSSGGHPCPLVVTCGLWWSPVAPGGHPCPLVVTCAPWWSPVASGGHLWPLVVTYGPWWSYIGPPQFPNMVNFLMLLGMMSDDHFSMFFKSLEYSIENTFGVLSYCHTHILCVVMSPVFHTTATHPGPDGGAT